MQSYVLVAVSLPQDRYLEAIFQEARVAAGKVKIDSRLFRDSTLAAAESFLLRYPDRHIAIVLETNSTDLDDIMEFDPRLVAVSPARIVWRSVAPRLAIPRLDAWAFVDDHIREEVEQAGIWQDPETATLQKDRQKIENAKLPDRAARISFVVQADSFDLEALKQQERQCRELCEFIERSLTPRLAGLAPSGLDFSWRECSGR